MTTITFPRPTSQLLSMNDRAHWSVRALDVSTWRTTAYHFGNMYRNGHQPPLPEYWCPPSMVVVTLDVPDRRRRDPINFTPCTKALVDGLVSARFWQDDTPEWVTTCEPVLRVVKGPLHVTVELVAR